MSITEATLSITEVMICWSGTTYCYNKATRGLIALIPWPDRCRRSGVFDCSTGACELRVHELTRVQRQHFVLSTALGLIVDYGIDPELVHRALWPLKEYRDGLPPDSRPPRPKTSESDSSDRSDSLLRLMF